MKNSYFYVLFLLALVWLPCLLEAQVNPINPTAPSPLESRLTSPNPTEQLDYLNLHHQLRALGFLTLLTLLPTAIIMMTSFTRITIIFHFLKQALATQNVPSTQVVVGLALILTGFVMQPVIQEIQDSAITPYLNNEFKNESEVQLGLKAEDRILMERIWAPMRGFMLQHVREKDLRLFLDIGRVELPQLSREDLARLEDEGTGPAYDLEAIPWYCLVPSFVMSELRMAFMMGFLLFMPFLVIDMVVASILMSMGMMMLPPVMISMPFKILLFIIVDGWRLIIQQVVHSFYPMGF